MQLQARGPCGVLRKMQGLHFACRRLLRRFAKAGYAISCKDICETPKSFRGLEALGGGGGQVQKPYALNSLTSVTGSIVVVLRGCIWM